MFPRTSAPAGRPRNQGARAAGCVDSNGQPFANKFSPGTCAFGSDQPILVGIDNDRVMQQANAAGAFGALNYNNVGLVVPGTNPIGMLDVGFGGGGASTFAVSFTSSCCWTAAGIFVDPQFLTFLAAGPTFVADLALVGLYAGNAYSMNLIGFGQGNTGQVPADMLTDPRQNSCPLIAEPSVDAGSPYVAVFTGTFAAAVAVNPIYIQLAMFGKASG